MTITNINMISIYDSGMSSGEFKGKENPMTGYLYRNRPHIIEVQPAVKWWNARRGTAYWKKHKGNLVVKIKCRVLNTIHTVEVKESDYMRWENFGEYAQNVFTYLSSEDRELLISGTSPAGWKHIFGDQGDH